MTSVGSQLDELILQYNGVCFCVCELLARNLHGIRLSSQPPGCSTVNTLSESAPLLCHCAEMNNVMTHGGRANNATQAALVFCTTSIVVFGCLLRDLLCQRKP